MSDKIMPVDKKSSSINEIYHPWKIIETRFSRDEARHHASLFALGNGYAGLRGSHEDCIDGNNGEVGTYLNGFYESADIKYGEIAYGYARESQTQLNVANPLPLVLTIDGERFNLEQAYRTGLVVDYNRSLSMNEGLLERSFTWNRSPGCRIRINSQRFVSLQNRHIAVTRYKICSLDNECQVSIASALDGRTRNRQSGDDPRVGSGLRGDVLTIDRLEADKGEEVLSIRQSTSRSGLTLACSMAHRVLLGQYAGPAAADESDLAVVLPESAETAERQAVLTYNVTLAGGSCLIIDKYIAFTDNREFAAGAISDKAFLFSLKARTEGFGALKEQQTAFMENFWHHAQVKLKGDLALQQGLRFNIFHLLQSAGRDGRTNISAKGLSGEGYEGHYFWDTEMYMLPFFLHTMPHISKALLQYRYSILPMARARAKEMGHARGALYAWRTINGNECSAYYPAGTAQFHINADIAYAVRRYLDSTGDDEFLWNMGAEIIFETAVFWLDLGFYNPQREGKFCLHCVTGPDEYNVLVNNNYYTNIMAQVNLWTAAAYARRMRDENKEKYDRLASRLGLDLDELASLWQQAADSMYLPYDKEKDLCLQDDAFLERVPWDFVNTPSAKYPLLLHFHPLVIYRHRVCKQADMVLAQMMHGSRFSAQQKKRSFNYYESCTTHDSSLSTSVFAVMACETGYSGKAFRYFMQTARLDLDDTHHNTEDGVHLANMAGTWIVLVNGYAGVRVNEGCLSFKPQIDHHWDSYQFRYVHEGSLLDININSRQATYTLLEGEKARFSHFDREVLLSRDNSIAALPLQPVAGNPDPPVQGVIFDVDGVLLSTDEQHYQAWKRLADEENIYFDRTINSRLRGISRMASLDILLEKAERQYNKQEKEILAGRKNDYYKDLISRLTPEDVLPGVRECLSRLKEMGFLLATGSSSRNAPVLLENTGLAGYFDAFADGNDISRSKPDPEVFLKAAHRLGLSPSLCLVVEDAAAGIDAASAGGFRSLAVGNAAERFLECDPDMQAPDLAHFQVEDIYDIV